MTLLVHLLLSIVSGAAGFSLLSLFPSSGPGRRGSAETIAASYLLGLMYLGASAWLIGRTGLPVGFGPLLLIQLVPAGLCAARLAVRGRGDLFPRQIAPGTFGDRRWWEWGLIALVASKLVYVLTMCLNGLLRSNDAFKGALALAKYTYYQGTYLGFVGRFEAAEGYPVFPGLILSWFGMGRGAWNEFGVNLAHFNYYAAFLLLYYAHLREGAGRRMGLVGVYVLSAIPLLLSHAVLAGYADLPMTIYLTAAGLYIYRYAREGRRGDWMLALLFVLFLPALKVEGRVPYFFIGIYVLGCAVLCRRGLVRARMIWILTAFLVAAAIGAVVALEMHYGAKGPPFLASIWGNLRPGNRLAEIAEPLSKHFIHYFNNWMVLGTIVALIFPYLTARFARGPELAPGLFGSLLLGSFIYLYFVGGAYLWLVSGTVANRTFLQIFPSLLFGALIFSRPLFGSRVR